MNEQIYMSLAEGLRQVAMAEARGYIANSDGVEGVYVSDVNDAEDNNERGGQKGGQKCGQKNEEKTIDTILQLIKNNPNITRKILAHTVGISPSAVQKHINRLKAAGVIIRHGGDRGGYWEIVD